MLDTVAPGGSTPVEMLTKKVSALHVQTLPQSKTSQVKSEWSPYFKMLTL